jgi:hypothetical protein
MWASLDITWLEDSDVGNKHLDAAAEKAMIVQEHAHAWKSLMFSSLSWQNYIIIKDYVENKSDFFHVILVCL